MKSLLPTLSNIISEACLLKDHLSAPSLPQSRTVKCFFAKSLSTGLPLLVIKITYFYTLELQNSHAGQIGEKQGVQVARAIQLNIYF